MNLENRDFTSLADGVGQSDIERARSLVMKMPDSDEKTRLMELVKNADRICSEKDFSLEEDRSVLEGHIDSYSRSVKRFAAIVEEHRLRDLN